MGWFFVKFFVLLEVLVFCNASDKGRRIDAELGKLVTVNLGNPPGNVSYCKALHFYKQEDNEEVDIQPFYNHTSDDDGILRRKFVDGNCTFTFNGILAEYRGKWIITTYYNETKTGQIRKVEEQIFMHLTEYVSPFPKSTFMAREGKYVTVDSLVNLYYGHSTCQLVNQQTNAVYDLTSLTDKDEGIVAVGNDCGVQMIVVPEREGQWSIEQEYDYLKRKFLFTIQIDEDNSTKIISNVWYRGSSAKLDLTSYDKSLCELKPPKESFISLKLQNCRYTIDNVEKDHEGIWIARYYLKNSKKIVEEHYDIKVNDPLKIIADGNDTGESISIASNISITGSVVCTFIGPFEQTFIVSETNLGTSVRIVIDKLWTQCTLSIPKYSYYYYEWKVSMKQRGIIVANTFVNMKGIETSELPSGKKRKINVTRGDFLTINCLEVDVEWDYCKIQTPYPQTIYSKTLQGVKDQHACNFFVSYANHSHEGNWICQYGLRKEKRQVTSVIKVVINMEKTEDRNIFRWYEPYNFVIDDPPRKLIKCEIVHVGEFSNQSYELNIPQTYREHEERHWNSFSSLASTNCGFRIEYVTSEYLGKWVITTTYLEKMDKLNKMNDIVFLYGPTDDVLHVRGGQGQYLTIDLPGRFAENVTCHLFNGNEEISSYELRTPVEKTMGACTFRIAVSENTTSFLWKILEEFSYGRRRRYFDISVWNGDTPEVEFKKDLYEKSTGSFTLESYLSDICNLKHPNGSVIPLKNSNCKYSLNNVSYADGGIWIAKYAGILGREDVIEEHYIVNILGSADISISYVDKKWISVSCALPIEEFSSRKCEFHSPSGEIISNNINNGIHGYRYHEVVDENSRGMCYVIYDGQLLPGDFGTWKCMLKNENHTIEASIKADARNKLEIRGNILRGIPTRHLYARRGAELKVTCGINATVNYCHLQLLNGKILEVKKARRQSMFQTSNSFSELNSCDFVVKGADYYHDGDWICEQNHHERTIPTKEIITVRVLDTELVSLAPRVSTSENKVKEIILECIQFPDEKKIISECLWIGPNKQRIVGWKQKTEQYLFTQNSNYCRLSFYYLYEAQIGNWTCEASYFNDSNSLSSVQLEMPNTVEVRDLPEITVDVIKIKKSIQIIFTMPFDNFTGTCMVTTPTDRFIYPHYDHYGYEVIVIPSNSSPSKFERICRLNIRGPHNEDYGMWKFHYQYDEIYISSTFNITNDISTEDIVYVGCGKNLKLQCEIPTSINSCRMISPQGIIHNIEETKKTGVKVNYTGKGFEFGECSASIELTDNLDIGNWTCELSVSGKKYVESRIFQVALAGSHLFSKGSSVNVRRFDETPHLLECYVNDGKTIQECSWIHPNGHEISSHQKSQFIVEGNETSCSILLKSWNENDFGNWKCCDCSDKKCCATVLFTNITESSGGTNNPSFLYVIFSVSILFWVIIS